MAAKKSTWGTKPKQADKPAKKTSAWGTGTKTPDKATPKPTPKASTKRATGGAAISSGTSSAKSESRVAPFLTAAQQAALNQYDYNYATRVQNEQRLQSERTADTNLKLAQAKQNWTRNTSRTNDAMAARGMFQSSIRDGALNDLDTALTLQQNSLNTNLQRVMPDSQTRLAKYASDYVSTHTYYNQQAAANAQGVTPTAAASSSTTTAAKTATTAPATTAKKTTWPVTTTADKAASAWGTKPKQADKPATTWASPKPKQLDKPKPATGGSGLAPAKTAAVARTKASPRW